MNQFCYRCDKVTESVAKEHPTYTDWLCAVCGYQVDCDYGPSDPDDSYEPVGSCDNCGVNLYEDDDEDLCDQCLWCASTNNPAQRESD